MADDRAEGREPAGGPVARHGREHDQADEHDPHGRRLHDRNLTREPRDHDRDDQRDESRQVAARVVGIHGRPFDPTTLLPAS